MTGWGIQFWTGSAEGDLELGLWAVAIYFGAIALATAGAAAAEAAQAWLRRRREARRPRRLGKAA